MLKLLGVFAGVAISCIWPGINSTADGCVVAHVRERVNCKSCHGPSILQRMGCHGTGGIGKVALSARSTNVASGTPQTSLEIQEEMDKR